MPDTEAPTMTDEEILAELQGYVNHGLIEYVLPTDPIGEQWVLGVVDKDGQPRIAKMNEDQVIGFLMGTSAAIRFFANRMGMKL